jgi:T4-like virus tail tube protein gp19
MAPELDPESGMLQAVNVVPDALWILEEAPPAEPCSLDVVRLRFDLVVRELETRRWRIAGLGLVPDDPRCWAALPDDLTLFPPPDAPQPDGATAGLSALAGEAARPRFPDAEEVRFFLPLGMGTIPDAGPRATALGKVDPAIRLERDGSETFVAGLFIDQELTGTFHDLPARALDKRYLRRNPDTLQGMHALYFVDEVTLLAGPDAVHRGWEAQQTILEAGAPLAAPVLQPIDQASEPPRARRSHAGPAGVSYELEQAADPAFERVQRRYRTQSREVALDVLDCPQDLWFRVRALSEREQSPWSNTEHARLPARDFDDCARQAVLAAPALSLPEDAGRDRGAAHRTLAPARVPDRAPDREPRERRAAGGGRGMNGDDARPVQRPFTALNFEVEIVLPGRSAPLCSAAFSECSGLEQSIQLKTIREGGNNARQIHVTGPVAYGQLRLKRGMSPSFDLWDWSPR